MYNLNEERSMGFINYKIHIRGKQCLEPASKKMIINKSIDLLETSEQVQIKKFRKSSKNIKMQWKEKIKAHQDKTYSDKEKLCLKEESTKFNVLKN